MGWLVTFGCIVGGWTLLRIISGERETRLRRLEHEAKLAQPDTSERK